MNSAKRWVWLLGVSVLAFFLCALALGAELDDISDLPWIEEQLAPEYADGDLYTATRQEMSLIRSTLDETPPAQREQALKQLAYDTKWGTAERATAYYVCAWYGVNYERCRDYLLNIAFWSFKPYFRHSAAIPRHWGEDTLNALYALYEWNHDLRILHELVTARTDAAGTTVASYIRFSALRDHPHAMLRVARMSSSAKDIVKVLLTDPAWKEQDTEFHADARAAFLSYAEKVAADDKDPLQKMALEFLLLSRK